MSEENRTAKVIGGPFDGHFWKPKKNKGEFGYGHNHLHVYKLRTKYEFDGKNYRYVGDVFDTFTLTIVNDKIKFIPVDDKQDET